MAVPFVDFRRRPGTHSGISFYVKHNLCKVSVPGGIMGGVGDVPIV